MNKIDILNVLISTQRDRLRIINTTFEKHYLDVLIKRRAAEVTLLIKDLEQRRAALVESSGWFVSNLAAIEKLDECVKRLKSHE